MIKSIEKNWPFISILPLFILLTALLFMPSMTSVLSMAALFMSLGMAIALIFRKQSQSYRAGKIERAKMLRNIFVDTIGLLLTMALAALVVRSMIEMINLSSVSWIGIGTAIALSVLIGLVVGWLVKVTWGRWTKAQ